MAPRALQVEVADRLARGLGVALVAASTAAAACPNCMSGEQKLDAVLRLVGLFLLLPFALVALGVVAIRRAQAEQAPPLSATTPAAGAGSAVASDGSPTTTA